MDICGGVRRVPYTRFGQTRLVPRSVYQYGEEVQDSGPYDKTLWIERPEDEYAFANPAIRECRTLVVRKRDWASSPIIAGKRRGNTA
jgi:hypothetical protein